MRNKILYLFTVFVLIFSAFFQSYADEPWQSWESKITNNPFKDWTVTFNNYLLYKYC